VLGDLGRIRDALDQYESCRRVLATLPGSHVSAELEQARMELARAERPANVGLPATPTVPPPRKPKPATHRSTYRPWAELLKRSFALDVQACARCAGRARLIALVTKRASIERFLRRPGEPTDVPALSPARGPPFGKSRSLRRRATASSPAQLQLFDVG